MTIITILFCLATIALGLFGFIAPRYTMSILDTAPEGSNMGLSETRASTGGLFVAIGAAGLIWPEPWALGMIGIAYLGAASGRALSLLLDNPPMKKAFSYFAFEAIFAAWFLWVAF